MSFILDALKKSDQERKRGKVPQLDSPSLSTPPSRDKRPVWPMLVVAALLVNASLLAWWLLPWRATSQPATTASPPAPSPSNSTQAEGQPKKQEAPLSQTQAKPPATAGNQSTPVATDKDKPQAAARDQRLSSRSSSKQDTPVKAPLRPGMESPPGGIDKPGRSPSEMPPTAEVPPKGTPRSRAQGADFKQLRETISTHLSEEIQRVENSTDGGAQTAPSGKTASAASKGVERPQPQAEGSKTKPDAATPSGTAIPDELPPSLSSEVPKMSFSGFVYSKSKADRMVIINGKVRREGDEVQSGLKLEEITTDGVVMSYKGQRFRRRI